MKMQIIVIFLHPALGWRNWKEYSTALLLDQKASETVKDKEKLIESDLEFLLKNTFDWSISWYEIQILSTQNVIIF